MRGVTGQYVISICQRILLLSLVKRGDENIIPVGDTFIMDGDVVVIYRG